MFFSVPCMRPDYTRSVFSPKLGIVVQDFTHQLFDQLLADHAVLAAGSSATVFAMATMAQCHDLPRIKTFPSNNYVRTRWDRSTPSFNARPPGLLDAIQGNPRPWIVFCFTLSRV